MPTKYLVDQDSKILARYSGGHDPLAETYGFYRSQIDPVLRPPLLPDLRLEVGLDGSRQLSWPDFDPSFRLEASGNLADNAWATLSAAVQTNDNRFWVELPADGTSSGHRFFRLIRR